MHHYFSKETDKMMADVDARCPGIVPEGSQEYQAGARRVSARRYSGESMCILMVIHKRVRGYPIVLAANRDEYYDRPSQAPHLLASCPAVWGGRDARAGGTWLGVNAYGLVVGLTNRRLGDDQQLNPQRRSRGLLCLEVLRCRTVTEAAELLVKTPTNLYNPFNILTGDQHELLWIAYDELPRLQCLEPGVHILANGNVNDVDTVRIRRARHLLQSTAQTELAALLPHLEQVCSDHEVGVQDRETICMHRASDNYGTVSSTILALPSDVRPPVYRYAPGHPCTIPYQEYSSLLFQT
jgi:uncharacterized protein with NRDE domain